MFFDSLYWLAFFGMLFIGLPWVVMHYVTRWKTQGTLTREDENMLEELYELSQRLEERVITIERIMSADNPGWRSLSVDTASIGISDETGTKGKVS